MWECDFYTTGKFFYTQFVLWQPINGSLLRTNMLVD